MSPHNVGFRGGAVPPEDHRARMQETLAEIHTAFLVGEDGPEMVSRESWNARSFTFDAPCPRCGEEIEWYADGRLQETAPGRCRTCTSRLPGVVKLREAHDRIVAEGRKP